MDRLTKPQKSVYDMEKFSGGSIAAICGSILVEGRKDTSKLIDAVHQLYQRNDALRIRILETENRTMQKFIPYAEQEIEVLSFAEKSDLETYANNYASRLAVLLYREWQNTKNLFL